MFKLVRRIIIFFCQRWKSTPINLFNLVKFDVSSLILANLNKIITKDYYKYNNANYKLQLGFVFSLCWWLNITSTIILRINLKMNFVTKTVTRKLDTCCRRVLTFFLWYFTHKGTWVLDLEIHNEVQTTQHTLST